MLRRTPITAVILLGLASSLIQAGDPHCFDQPCSGRLERVLRRAQRCFRPAGACIFDDTVTCWDNGARSVTSVDPESALVTVRNFGPHGRLCLTMVVRPAAASPGGGRVPLKTTYKRGGRAWTVIPSSDGIQVRCPSGRIETYTAEHLASPPCRGTADE